MGDLCQNCGDCHLGSHPRPCHKDLVECTICHNFGHQFIFCPKSVKILDKSFEYFMICHNCDQWHLPKPCQYDFAHCVRCNNYGHLPHFCPRSPIQRSQDPNSAMYAVNVNQIHPELLRKIQIDVCTDVLRLLEKHTKEEVFAYLSRPILPSLQTAVATVPSNVHILPAPMQMHSGDGRVHHRQHSNAGGPPPVAAHDSPVDQKQVSQGVKAEDPGTYLDVPPTPNSPLGQMNVPKQGLGIKEEKLEDIDDVKKEGSQPKASSKVKNKRTPSATKDKVTKPKSMNRRAPQPRCAECKKRHKRCEHGANALDAGDAYGASQSPQPNQTPSTNAGAANSFGDEIGAPGPMEDAPSALVRLPVPQSDRHGAVTQTNNNAQSNHFDGMTQQQQDALRTAAAAMPALAPRGTPQYHNFGQTQWMHNAAQQAIAEYHEQATPAPLAESQAANTLAPLMSFNQEDDHVAGFQPPAHVVESNGHAFVHTNQQMGLASDTTNTVNPNQMMSPDPGFSSPDVSSKRLVSPNHHNSGHVFTFGENGQVIDSVEQEAIEDTAAKVEAAAEGGHGDGMEDAEANKGSAGGRKNPQALSQGFGSLTDFPEDDDMLE